MTWHLENHWVLIDDPSYTFSLDEWRDADRQMMFVHLTFHHFSKCALMKFSREFAAFRACTDAPLYASGPNTDAKFARFVARFGFKHLCDCEGGRKIFINKG